MSLQRCRRICRSKNTERLNRTDGENKYDDNQKHSVDGYRQVLPAIVLHRFICVLVMIVASFLDPVYDLSQDTSSVRRMGWLRRDEALPRYRDVLASFSAWDSHHYLSIAELGYIYEHQFAFHPLYPFISRLLSETISYAGLGRQGLRLILSSGIFISNAFALLSSLVLYKLAKKLTGDNRTSAKAAMLFSMQPASSFFSAMYPESLFSLLSFLGMNYLIDNSLLKASLMFMLSGMAKPNSLIYIGFFLWYLFLDPALYDGPYAKRGLLSKIFYFLLYSTIILLPFFSMQLMAYGLFCRPSVRYHDPPTWCMKNVPSVFFHVQATFWDNGFMRSWSFDNLENIAVAAPLVAISTAALIEYLNSDVYNVMGIWIFGSYLKKLVYVIKRKPVLYSKNILKEHIVRIYPHPINYPFMVHWAVVTAIVVFYMQIQTGIRALISTPMLHIYVASLHNQKKISRLKSYSFSFILNYYILYSIAASVLLAYGYPPI